MALSRVRERVPSEARGVRVLKKTRDPKGAPNQLAVTRGCHQIARRDLRVLQWKGIGIVEPSGEQELFGAPSPGLALLGHPLPQAGEGYKEQELIRGKRSTDFRRLLQKVGSGVVLPSHY